MQTIATPWGDYKPRPVLMISRAIFLAAVVVAIAAFLLDRNAMTAGSGGSWGRFAHSWPWALLGVASLFYAAATGFAPLVPWNRTPAGRIAARAITIAAVAAMGVFCLVAFYLLSGF